MVAEDDRRRLPKSTISSLAPKCRRCLPTYRKRLRIRSRSPVVARSGRRSANHCCLVSPAPTSMTLPRPEAAEAAELASQAWEGLARRIESHGLAPGLTLEDYHKRLEFELGIITRMKFPGYFLIVADFIKWAKAHGISRRPRPRFGRRFAGRLLAHHHRPRPPSVRPAFRALPQSRTRVDAGLRHRLLPGPSRRGDPLRPGGSTAVPRWPRSSPSVRCRRAPCCATSVVFCRCPTARSTSSASWCRRIRPIR